MENVGGDNWVIKIFGVCVGGGGGGHQIFCPHTATNGWGEACPPCPTPNDAHVHNHPLDRTTRLVLESETYRPIA